MTNEKNDPIELDEILRCEVGSRLHGLNVKDTDDQDLVGVFIEKPAQVLGLAGGRESYVWRTAGTVDGHDARSGPGDVDLTRYSLRKYVSLAVGGNPSILTLLYAPESAFTILTPLGRELRELRPAIVSRRAGQRFLGYLTSQRERMVGEGKQSRVPKRPELVEKYGWDTKYAGHALRLGLQGVELMQHGTLSLPMEDSDRQLVLQVRLGKYSFKETLDLIDSVSAVLKDCLDDTDSPLPIQPDMDAINDWMVSAHLRRWAELGDRAEWDMHNEEWY
jgi:predicted nucleotidyltransferase